MRIPLNIVREGVENVETVLTDYSYGYAYYAFQGDAPISSTQILGYENPRTIPRALYGVSAIDNELFNTMRQYFREGAGRPEVLGDDVNIIQSNRLTNNDLYFLQNEAIAVPLPAADWNPPDIDSTATINTDRRYIAVTQNVWPADKTYLYCTFSKRPHVLVKSRFTNVYWGFNTNFLLVFAVKITVQAQDNEQRITEAYQIKGRSQSRIVEDLFRRDVIRASNIWCSVFGKSPSKTDILAFMRSDFANVEIVLTQFREAAMRGAGQLPDVPLAMIIDNQIPDQFTERYNRVIMNLLPIRQPVDDILLRDDGGYDENRVFRYLEPSRFAVFPDQGERPDQDDAVEQLSFLGGQDRFPAFTPNTINPALRGGIDDLLRKVRECPVNIGNCLFGHQYSTPFATSGSKYSKYRHIPFCTQHLLSVFGIGLEYDKDVTMTQTCTVKEDTYGPYAIAEGLSKYKDFVFRRRQCIYPRFVSIDENDINGNVMAALSILFASSETIPYLGLSRNLTNFLFWVLESTTTKIGNICKPWDLINVMKCDRPAMDGLATIIAFVLWGQSNEDAPLDTLFPYLNSLDFCTDVAKKLHQLNLLNADCRRMHGINCYNYFVLKLLEYNTDARVLYNQPNVNVNDMTGITAISDICRGENLTAAITDNVLTDAYRMFKEYNAGANRYLPGRKPMFVKPPTKALTLKSPQRGESVENVVEMEFRKSSLSQVADSCNGFYNARLEVNEPVELRLVNAQRAITQFGQNFRQPVVPEQNAVIANNGPVAGAAAAGLAQYVAANPDYQLLQQRLNQQNRPRIRAQEIEYRLFPAPPAEDQQE